ncbi:hypothetical protein EVAR_102710_1 [Eumeta japonica]|uniref:Uncharacterized protein n=1 Tax=Eumeta variegata TaxID=151549 RepID=A0A4C1TIW7_EUMVA|nr:hypothetical protein EVAR_102710_1 [Eumeta japonica]
MCAIDIDGFCSPNDGIKRPRFRVKKNALAANGMESVPQRPHSAYTRIVIVIVIGEPVRRVRLSPRVKSSVRCARVLCFSRVRLCGRETKLDTGAVF